MAHTPDQHALQNLQTEVEEAISLLRTLTKAAPSHVVGKSQRLPVEELQLARGIAFLQAKKAGFIISGVGGHGFLLRKIPNSPSGWSAPFLFDLKSLGVGASAGFSETSSLLILDTEHAVLNFMHGQASLDSEVTVAAGPAAREMHNSEFNIGHPQDTFSGTSYSVAHGAMIDVSFQGVKMGVRRSAMHKIYGDGVSEHDIIEGKVAQLPVLEPLTSELNLLQQQGTTPAAEAAKIGK